jgi:hypothetical protein
MVIVYFAQWFENHRRGAYFWATFSRSTDHVLILTKKSRATFWATFSQTHLVTLAGTENCTLS